MAIRLQSLANAFGSLLKKMFLALGAISLTIGPAALVGAAQSNRPKSITLGDNGKTISLKVNERFLLNLGDAFEWEIQELDTKIINRVPGIMTVKGSQGVFETVAVGETKLTAIGNPPCRNAKPPCMILSRQFQVKIVVTAKADGSDGTPATESRSAASYAIVDNSGSTNTDGYRITIGRTGSVNVTIKSHLNSNETSQRSTTISRELAQRFFHDLSAAMPLAKLPGGGCPKSTSFGTSLYVEYQGQRTPDLACPQSGARLIRLEKDVKAVTAALRLK